MKRALNIILVDNDPYTTKAYPNILNQYGVINSEYNINILTAKCYDSAIKTINQKREETYKSTDVAFIEMRLPSSVNGKYCSGEDLCVYLKQNFPKVKIIVITSRYETLILSGVIQNVNPDAMLLKGDVNRAVIFDTLTKTLNNQPYYSIGVLTMLRKKLSSRLILEPIDRQILYELWKGTQTKDLVNYVPLSMGAIEKRKRKLRLEVGAKCKNDALLVDLVLQKGFQ
ncbi:response regulator [Winogradskyella luteola]|uniref:Response regulator transcription factor n=1 Tax=Winogradskyella luteola TaxID=2828330 RepID=A0A9X1JN19_9FLAO|nr:response regulator [Winogradskyella luteola]MBV7269080.1 response regulator transcription factor [Winogradskyella luteola]